MLLWMWHPFNTEVRHVFWGNDLHVVNKTFRKPAETQRLCNIYVLNKCGLVCVVLGNHSPRDL